MLAEEAPDRADTRTGGMLLGHRELRTLRPIPLLNRLRGRETGQFDLCELDGICLSVRVQGAPIYAWR
jgi:hypothetical protein